MSRFAGALATAAGALIMAPSVLGLSITPSTDPATLAAALGGGGTLTIDSVSVSNGNASQFGIFNGFTSAPIVIGDGVVLSTGFADNTTSDSHSFLNFPSSNMGAGGTTEFDTYGPGHIASFGDSNDVTAVTVHFTLSADSQVGFDFIFGSVEYPTFVGSFTDAFLAFLDGTAPGDQIVFDAFHNPVRSAPASAAA